MFIIFGSPRSGTTMLKEMICQHPQLKIPHETDFIIPAAFILDRVKDEEIGKQLIAEMICSTSAFAPSLGRHLSREDIYRIVEKSQYSLTDQLAGIYSALAEKTGATDAGDKSPNDLAFVGILNKTGLFESTIKIIHIVRDVRDVLISLKKTTWAPADIENFFPRIWAGSNLNLSRFASQGRTPYLLVRYEDLVLDASLWLRRICEFLEVDFDENMLNFSKSGKELSHLSHHRNLGEGLLQSRRFAWKKDEDTEYAKHSYPDACTALRQFGYDC